MEEIEGDWFTIRKRLRQGCIMSLTLFDDYKVASKRKVRESETSGVMVGEDRVVNLDFADDAPLLADT